MFNMYDPVRSVVEFLPAGCSAIRVPVSEDDLVSDLTRAFSLLSSRLPDAASGPAGADLSYIRDQILRCRERVDALIASARGRCDMLYLEELRLSGTDQKDRVLDLRRKRLALAEKVSQAESVFHFLGSLSCTLTVLMDLAEKSEEMSGIPEWLESFETDVSEM